MKTLLELADLHVSYGAVEVLKGIDLAVNAGECVALIGANGAGKSTTLMAISGLIPQRRGKISFQENDLLNLSPEEIVAKGVVQVPEGRHIFPRLSVLENLQMGAVCRKDRQGIPNDLERIFHLFPILSRRRKQLAGTLSGGEQQMLALGRGLIGRPKLLLLDEPSLGLAPKVVTQLFQVIRQIHEEQREMAILLVEQNAYQALQIAGRGYVLETGRVALAGSAHDLRQNPAVKQAYLGG